MLKASFFIITQCLVVVSLFSQNINKAHRIVDTLTSPYFAGRSVANKGELKAAHFIAKEFKQLGLQSFDDTYFQNFNYKINTIVGELLVQIDATPLIAGKDYIVGANSGSINGTFELIWYNKTNLPNKKQLHKLTSRNFFTNKFIVIDDEGVEKDNELFQLLKLNVFAAEGVIFLKDKLTHSLARSYQDYAILHLKKGVITRTNKSITLTINQQLVRNYQSQNVIGFIKGTEFPDSVVVVSAHYDHLGGMGDVVYFPGANDNASGIAMLLNLAEYYSVKEPPSKTIVFMAFGAEEAGILGSKHFIEHPTFILNSINFVINLDVIGTGGEGVMVVNGAVHQTHFKMLEEINNKNNYVFTIKKRGKAANSDHYWFSEKGIPAFFIYALGGIKAYHDVDDIAATLPLTYFDKTFRLIRDFIDEL